MNFQDSQASGVVNRIEKTKAATTITVTGTDSNCAIEYTVS